MKLLFIHGGEKLKEDNNGNYYTDGSYNDEVWKRYDYLSNDITVMFRKENKIFDKNEAKEKFQIFDKKKYKFVEIKDFSNIIKDYFNFKKRVENNQIIKEQVIKSDIIIVRVPANSSYKAAQYAKNYNKPYLVEVVGCIWDTLWNHSLRGKMIAPFKYVKMKNIIKDAPYVSYVSNNFLQKRYPTKGQQLACSDVVLKEINENVLKERLKKIYNKKNNDKIILGTVAAVNVKYKGQQYVIKAISKLNKIGYNFEYQLVGGGNNNYLKKVAKKYKIEDKVIFFGSLQHDEVFEFMKKIDIYIQPSNVEGLCRALIEAMSVACPCVASNAGGNPELINEKYIFEKKSVKNLKKLLKEFDKEKMLKQAKKNFERVEEFKNKKLDRKKFYKLLTEKGRKNEVF